MDMFSALLEDFHTRAPELELREYEPMERHTSFRVGGPARLMVLPRTEGQARRALSLASARGISPFFLGNGTNLLVSDRGYPGLVVKLAGQLNQERVTAIREENRRLIAGAGVLLSQLANAAWGRNLTGLEFAQGIPGTVGGGVVMNAGAYGGELCQVLASVTALEPDGTRRVFPAAECNFGYRKSFFSDGRRLILEAAFALEPGDEHTIKARMEDLAARRREKQPLEYPSAGSTFKRPQGYFAAALIEDCGLKGASVGGAQVSEKHAGFVINRGGATAEDIVRLMDHVRETVQRQTGVTLEPEVKLLGF